MIFFSFWDDFGIVALILVFFGLYNLLSEGVLRSRFLALIVTVIVIYLVVIPYDWFKYLLFVMLFLGAAISRINPGAWFGG